MNVPNFCVYQIYRSRWITLLHHCGHHPPCSTLLPCVTQLPLPKKLRASEPTGSQQWRWLELLELMVAESAAHRLWCGGSEEDKSHSLRGRRRLIPWQQVTGRTHAWSPGLGGRILGDEVEVEVVVHVNVGGGSSPKLQAGRQEREAGDVGESLQGELSG